MKSKRHDKLYPVYGRVAFAFSLLPLLFAAPAAALQIRLAEGEVEGSFDTTLSYGQLYRVQGMDKTNDDVNGNDGNRNFETGRVSEVYKITSDLGLNWRNYGLFMRGTAFYDSQIMDRRNDFYKQNNPQQPAQSFPQDNRFTRETRHKAGRDAQLLDAYLFGNWDIAGHSLRASVGRQVFNWGEGLFYRGGINTTNPIDAAKFRLPGAEIKEVLVPVESFNISLSLTDNLSMEAFYQWNWKESAMDPVGTFFSETDLFADGGNTGYSSLGTSPLALALPFYAGGNFCGTGGLCEGRGGQNFIDSNGLYGRIARIDTDLNAKNDGQFGVNLKYLAESLNSTEFGLYFVNYHGKEPVIYADLNGYAGVDLAALTAALGNGVLAGGLATIDLLGNVRAKREYVENIRMLGLSFNTAVGNASVFGELSYRPNMPIGVSATNDLVYDMALQGAQMADNNGSFPGSGTALMAGKRVTRSGSVHNYERVEMYNSSLGSIYNFGPMLGFNAVTGVAELASEHIRGSSLKYQAFNGTPFNDTRYYSGRGNTAYVDDGRRDDQVNRNAYGYTLVLSGTWNDAFAGVNVSPYLVYKDDFEGNSHMTGNFVEGRKAYTLGLRGNYSQRLEAELQYTEFWGGGQNNKMRDRDNIGINIKYSF
ncbi:glycine/betaine transmethylase [Ventosimonas gracilis]|uniref:Glycine/betaine transmethylase n=1 Tax=Ventosimonas gracilis TaxID=1680762 RepID=A0A139SW11_9GAMM|nr:DUF1302 domain-containing protein [Ventosimonas gracilis]KXU38785.1 glycine/betaine transmethylase [Ventosimonas gracilis]